MDTHDHVYHIESKAKQKTKKRITDFDRFKKYLNSFSSTGYEIERDEHRTFQSNLGDYLSLDKFEI